MIRPAGSLHIALLLLIALLPFGTKRLPENLEGITVTLLKSRRSRGRT
jgi:Sec-independent protein translocase protein TatA